MALNYTITKKAENTYTLSLVWTTAERTAYKQKSTLHLVKEDSDGTKNVQDINLPVESIASFAGNENSPNYGSKINGFVCGIDATNLAIGGVYYSIDSVDTVEEPDPTSEEIEEDD